MHFKLKMGIQKKQSASYFYYFAFDVKEELDDIVLKRKYDKTYGNNTSRASSSS